jgi:hypothetical protein
VPLRGGVDHDTGQLNNSDELGMLKWFDSSAENRYIVHVEGSV